MKEKLSKERLDRFNLIMRDLRAAIKNSTLYDPKHPLFVSSVKDFKTRLDEWFLKEEKMDLGISQDNLLLDGARIKEKTEIHSEIADYMHARGILALSFIKDVGVGELTDFFNFIRNDVKTIRKKKGILNNIPPTPHLKIKEIDYSALLVRGKEVEEASEEEIWRSLSDIADESMERKLPESKFEFLVQFFMDPRKSAKMLNNLYREASAKLENEAAADDIRGTIAKIYKYLGNVSGGDMKERLGDLTRVISQLQPDLVARLFDPTKIDGSSFDLAKEITQNFSDDFIAEFVESLISGEGVFNEKLLKVFDKLAPGEAKASSVTSMIAERLFDKKLLHADYPSKLQESISKVFNIHPESDFMSQMYQITVDAFINRKIDKLVYVAKLSPLITRYVKSAGEEKLKREEAELLLNIIWLEDDPDEFAKFSSNLMDIFPEILGMNSIKSVREIFELFIEKIRPEQKANERIMREVEKVMDKITGREVLDSIISFIPESGSEDQEDIVYILLKADADAAGLLLDAFVSERDRSCRDRIGTVLCGMKGTVTEDIVGRLDNSDPAVTADLFRILKVCDPDKARSASRKLLSHAAARIRLQGLEAFEPGTEEEMDIVFGVLKKEKNEEVQKAAMTVLLKTGNAEILNGLFVFAEKNFFKRKLLLRLVELCGRLKVRASLPYLERILFKRSLFNPAGRDKLRVIAVVSLGQLRTDEAMGLIKKGLEDKREKVRKMCEIILKLDKRGKNEQINNGADADAAQ